MGGFTPVIDENTGEITGYTTTIGGADTVFPFKKEISSELAIDINETYYTTDTTYRRTIYSYSVSMYKYMNFSVVNSQPAFKFGITISGNNSVVLWNKGWNTSNGSINNLDISDYDIILIQELALVDDPVVQMATRFYT